MKLPPEAADALVIARIYTRHDVRRRELMLATSQLPWWQTLNPGADRMNLLTPAQRKELRDLNSSARNEVLRVLGPAALDRDGVIAARYDFLPAERAVAVDALLRDYQDVEAGLREEMHGLRTAADREREALVESERRRDLAKLLSPQDFEIFELRTSLAADNIRTRLTVFEPNEEEYRAVFAVYKEFHEKNPGSVGADGQKRPAYFPEYPEYEQKVRAILGETRYADWALAGQTYTTTLARLAPDLGLSSASVKEAAVLLRDTAARSWAIGEDTTLGTDEKLAALSTLAAITRSALSTKLGESAKAAVAQSAPWLEMIANGNAVKVEGNGTSWRSVNSSARPPLPRGGPSPFPNSPSVGAPSPKL